MKTLNSNEKKVLVSLYNQMLDCTGGEFGYTASAYKYNMGKNEFAGYVSSLEAKGCFEYLEPLEHMKNVKQYALTEEATIEARKIQGLVITVQTNNSHNIQTTQKSKIIMKNETRVLTQDTTIGEKTYKAGTKFVIESIKYCVMQIKIGKAKVSANLNLVKSWASEPVATA